MTNTNTYKVVVIASDDAPGAGIADRPPGRSNAVDPIMRSGRKFTVRVTNAPETGSVTVDRRYPLVERRGDRHPDGWRCNR